MGRAAHSQTFCEVVSLITVFFPAAKPADSCVVDRSPWFDDFGVCRQRDPLVFLSLFDKLAPVKKEIEDKFVKVTDDMKKATTALPAWSDVCRMGDLPDYFKAPKVNESFSQLLDRPVSNSQYVSISLEGMTKLETCIGGMIESQSFSLWALVSVFAFLKDLGCVLEEAIFHQLISSLQVSLNSQAKALFASTSFLKEK